MPQHTRVRSFLLSRLPEYLFFTVALAILFVTSKLLMLGSLHVLDQVSIKQFAYDLLTALLIGAFAFCGRVGRIATVTITMLFYALSIHLALGGGDYLDATTIHYLSSGSDMADNIGSDVPWGGYIAIILLIVAYGIGAEPFLLPRFTKLRPRIQWSIFLISAVLTMILLLLPTASIRTATYRNPIEYIVTDAIALSAQEDVVIENRNTFSYISKYESPKYNIPPQVNQRALGKQFNVVVLLMESTTFHSMAGKEKRLMPTFWDLGRNGVFFDNFYANVPLSLKTIMALHSGCSPAADWAYISKSRPELPLKTLPRYLKNAGYRTALLHGGHFSFSSKLKYLGNRGYDIKYDGKSIPGGKEYKHTSWGVDDKAIFKYASEWITRNDKPFYINFIPISPHSPYETPDDFPLQEYVKDPKQNAYLNAVHYIDTLLGDFVTELKSNGVFDDTIFVVVGDHGEAFQQHYQNTGHSYEIYEENVHVPFVISNPKLFKGRQHAKQPASHADILPTILELVGSKQPFHGSGRSLFSLPDNRMVFLFTQLRGQSVGLRDGAYKYLYNLGASRHSLYRVDTDPGEKKNIAKSETDRVEYYHTKALQWYNYSKRYIKYVNAKGKLMSTTKDGKALLSAMPIFFSAPENRIRINVSETRKPFKIQGKHLKKSGIGTHAPSIVTYDVARFQGHTFEVSFAHDDGSDQDSLIKAQIWMDGKVVYNGKPINKTDGLQRISLPIKGRLLSLVAMKAGDGVKFDHVNWIEPSISIK